MKENITTSEEVFELVNSLTLSQKIDRSLNLIDEALVHNPTNYQALRWGGIIFSYAKYYIVNFINTPKQFLIRMK